MPEDELRHCEYTAKDAGAAAGREAAAEANSCLIYKGPRNLTGEFSRTHEVLLLCQKDFQMRLDSLEPD